MNAVKIAIVDDHPLYRTGVRSMLEKSNRYDVKIEAGNGKELLEKMSRQKVDLVITDINMPEMDGFELARILCRDYKAVKVLINSMSEEILLIKKLLEIGVHGFVLKATDGVELLQCLERILENKPGLCSKTEKLLFNKLLQKDAEVPQLCNREKQLLYLIDEEKSKEEIGAIFAISTRRSEMLIRNLKEKLQVKTQVGLVKWLYAHRWMM